MANLPSILSCWEAGNQGQAVNPGSLASGACFEATWVHPRCLLAEQQKGHF